MCTPTEGGRAFINELNERKLVNPTPASRGQGGTRQTRWTGVPFQPVGVAGAGEELSSLCVVAKHGPFGGALAPCAAVPAPASEGSGESQELLSGHGSSCPRTLLSLGSGVPEEASRAQHSHVGPPRPRALGL